MIRYGVIALFSVFTFRVYQLQVALMREAKAQEEQLNLLDYQSRQLRRINQDLMGIMDRYQTKPDFPAN